jgi:hypothetical protein
MKIAVFLAVMPCSLVCGYQCFERAYYVCTQYENYALKMKAADTSLQLAQYVARETKENHENVRLLYPPIFEHLSINTTCSRHT